MSLYKIFDVSVETKFSLETTQRCQGDFQLWTEGDKTPTFFDEAFDVQQSTKRELRTVGTQLEVHSIDWCSGYRSWWSIGLLYAPLSLLCCPSFELPVALSHRSLSQRRKCLILSHRYAPHNAIFLVVPFFETAGQSASSIRGHCQGVWVLSCWACWAYKASVVGLDGVHLDWCSLSRWYFSPEKERGKYGHVIWNSYPRDPPSLLRTRRSRAQTDKREK